MNESLKGKTNRLQQRNVRPRFIIPCCFGEDLAAWVKQELLRLPGFDFSLSEGIQGDYGWGLWASRGKDRFWIALSCVGNIPQEALAQWVVTVIDDPGVKLTKHLFHKPDRQALGHLLECVRQALEASNTIRSIKA